MSISNIQQNYIQYNSNNSSQYIIQQSYQNNTQSQPMIVPNNYNNTYQSTVVNTPQYQSYSIPQTNQIVSNQDSNTFIKVQSPYESMGVISSNQQQNHVYAVPPSTQPVQQIYNTQGYIQSPSVINSNNITYQQQPQSQILINPNTTTNTLYSSQLTQAGVTQNVLTTVTQAGLTSVVEQISSTNKQSEGTNQNSQVLPLFQKQPQQTINFSNSTVITNSPVEKNNDNSNNKNPCIYTPLQTPNSSPVKKENVKDIKAQTNTNIINTYPSTTIAQEKNDITKEKPKEKGYLIAKKKRNKRRA